MKRFYVVNLLWMSFMVAMIGCAGKKQKADVEFYYYPEKNVYYNVARETYAYSVDSGKTWQTLNTPNNEDPATLGKKEVIFFENDSAWIDNEAHRKMYGGKIYNIVVPDTAPAIASQEVKERYQPPKNKPKAVKEEPVKEKKHGLKDFFGRLFGKKKKE